MVYIETNTTELSLQPGSSDTAELRFTRAYGAVRMTLNTGGAPIKINEVTKILVELPGRGGQSRRLHLDGAEVKMMPLIAAFGSGSAAEAASASSYPMFIGNESQTPSYAYIDIPVGANANEEMRVTLETDANAPAVTVKFSALTNVANRNLIFDVSSLGQGSRVDYTFRSDATPFGVIVGSGAAAYVFDALAANAQMDITEINFDGLPRYTYDDASAMNAELDRVITSTSFTSGGANQDVGRDAAHADCVYSQCPPGVDRVNIEATTANNIRWVVAAYTTAGVGA